MATATAADLASHPLFSGLSEAELGELAGSFEARTVGPGVRLVGEGVSGHSLFLLCSGEARVSAGGVELATLGAGDFFGELALLGGGRRRATVTTASEARILVVFGPEFAQLKEAQPALAATIEAAMRERAAALD